MIKFTANYSYTNPNFVIQNLPEKYEDQENLMFPFICVLKNILQRGYPTVMSKYLQNKIGQIHKNKDYFSERLLLIDNKTPKWFSTIKGSKTSYNPAKNFFENIIPDFFGEYAFIQSLLLPEVKISEIVDEYDNEFVDQQVDFYLPQAKLVIEIDGSQHKDNVQAEIDIRRDYYFRQFGIKTVRILTSQLKNANFDTFLPIFNRLKQYENVLKYYRNAFNKATNFTNDEIHDKLLPTAIIRFQLLLLELLERDYLQVDKTWNFNIRCDEPLDNFAELAVEDVFVWLNNLYKLKYKQELSKFDYKVNVSSGKEFKFDTNAINIDFSLQKRYTDENNLEKNIIFVRTDYFDYNEKKCELGRDKNYFSVSTAESINYNITDQDIDTLEFFLKNIFDKENFRSGQFSIISNALNLRDTIGLLPTGGGKSICFQLPCLLQPSINFVVSPIKSLMYDQIENLKQDVEKDGVAIKNINMICGDQKPHERDTIMSNYTKRKYLFIYISPERFQIQLFRDTLQSTANESNISYAVIDEVHCMSEWGHDFRTSYLHLTKTIDNISPKDEKQESKIKYIGLTATASESVLKDIKVEFSRCDRFDADNVKTLLDYTRPELDFIVVNDKNQKFSELSKLLKNNHISQNDDKAALIFTPYVNNSKTQVGCYVLSNNLGRDYPNKVSWYSGSCPTIKDENGRKREIMSKDVFDAYKQKVQKDFKDDKYQILCATKAFGMGIDKSNIYYTFHYGLPASIESLYQEAGRAGRWDKNQEKFKDARGKCYVLYTPEEQENANVINEIFNEHISIEELKNIQNQIREKGTGRDIFSQLFLFLQNLRPIKDEFESIIKIVDCFYRKNEIVEIFYDKNGLFYLRDGETNSDSSLKINFGSDDKFEKEVYRLSLLGIVDDWTRDFKSNFKISFKTTDANSVIDNLQNYIHKYEPDNKVKDNIANLKVDGCDTELKKSIWFLLEWIYKNITESRKQSLKNIYDLCVGYRDSESFQKVLESYFIISDVTAVLQYIAENSNDYEKWFSVFYSKKETDSENRFISKNDIETLRGTMMRFLESYHNSPGLNFISGMISLILNDFDNSDGGRRMESALQAIQNSNADNLYDNYFITNIHTFLRDANLSEEKLTEICLMIVNYFPAKLEFFAEYFNLPLLYADKLNDDVRKLRKINSTIYETIRKFK